jgi:hypothetical protein
MTTSKIALVTLALLLSVGASTRPLAANDFGIQHDDFATSFNHVALNSHLKARLTTTFNCNIGPCLMYEAYGLFTLSLSYSTETGSVHDIQISGNSQMDPFAFLDTLLTTTTLIAPQLSKEERETAANEMFDQGMRLTSRKVHRLNGFQWNAGSGAGKFGEGTVIFFNQSH